MSDLCSSIVERLGDAWGWLGWLLFGAYFLGAWFAPTPEAMWTTSLIAGALLLVWWIIDIADQQPAAWQIVVGIVMLAIGILPRGGLLQVACWALYWTRVRE